MIKVLIDTNSLIYFFDNKTDLYSEFDKAFSESFSFYTISPCIEELKRLGKKDVIKWMEFCKINTVRIENKGKVDDNILEVAKKESSALISSDRELLNRARSAGIRIFKVGGRGVTQS